jgi:hypothetical protein
MHARARQTYAKGEYATVEGEVSDFHPMPYSGHQNETFAVNGVQFSYSDYVVNPCFNNTVSHGGPIREGIRVRVTAAGVPNLLFHDLRRTAARNLRRAGVAEGVIMKIGGWRTRSVFERYAIVSQTDIAEAMRKLEVQQNGHTLGHSREEEEGSPSQDSSAKSF